jgi:hypothetical protein
MIKTLLFALIALALTGCATSPPAKEVIVKTTVVAPDDDMLGDCELQEPPDPDVYRTSNADKKELMLTQAFVGASGKIIVCNTRWAKLREWKKKQKGALTSTPEAK